MELLLVDIERNGRLRSIRLHSLVGLHLNCLRIVLIRTQEYCFACVETNSVVLMLLRLRLRSILWLSLGIGVYFGL